MCIMIIITNISGNLIIIYIYVSRYYLNINGICPNENVMKWSWEFILLIMSFMALS